MRHPQLKDFIYFCRIGDLGDGSYTLTAKGRAPINFDQSQKLEYVHKGYSIYIQTDKAIYRPGMYSIHQSKVAQTMMINGTVNSW